ncbi:MAG: sarcosine oxidase subunit gamma family protein [Pseudomonadota bacterium]
MSERVFEGLATITETAPRGMIAVRGDLASKQMAKAVGKVPARGTCTGEVAWMSPDEVLVMCPRDKAEARIATLTKALAGTHHMVTDVSDARAVFTISGKGARDVMAKVCPVDFRPAAFGPGQFRRTRIAQVACAFWLDDAGAFHLICFRSVADYVWAVLEDAAQKDAAVGYFAG